MFVARRGSSDLSFGGLLFRRLVLLLRAGRIAGLLRRFLLAAAAPVVGRVETGPAEMDRYRIEHSLDRRGPANGTLLRRRLGDALEDFEDVPVRALVLIRRHGNERR